MPRTGALVSRSAPASTEISGSSHADARVPPNFTVPAPCVVSPSGRRTGCRPPLLCPAEKHGGFSGCQISRGLRHWRKAGQGREVVTNRAPRRSNPLAPPPPWCGAEPPLGAQCRVTREGCCHDGQRETSPWGDWTPCSWSGGGRDCVPTDSSEGPIRKRPRRIGRSLDRRSGVRQRYTSRR